MVFLQGTQKSAITDKNGKYVIADGINKVIVQIERIENLISEWRPSTQISQVNQNAGIKPLKVDKEVFEITKKAIWFSEISNGAFDVSIVAMDKIWLFDGTMEKLPSKKELKKSILNVNYKNIVLDPVNSTIFLIKKRNENRFWFHWKRICRRQKPGNDAIFRGESRNY